MIASVDLFLNIIPSNIQVTAKSDGFLSINEVSIVFKKKEKNIQSFVILSEFDIIILFCCWADTAEER